MSEENTNGIDLSGLGSFDFTPAWAKTTEKVTVQGNRERVQARGNFADAPQKKFSDRQRKSFGEKRSFDKPRFDKPRFEKPKPLACEVKILPETKALGTIIRKLQGDTHAYKLKDLAYFFLDTPESILLKITPKTEEGAQPIAFCQCKACGFVSTNVEDVVDHIVNVHLADYYDAKEIDCEPPKGNFTCVAQCGLSGVLLGPPNIHEFNAVVKEMIRTCYPDMSETEYRARIVMVRDAESIEKWRAGAVRKTVYFQKGQAEVEGAPQMTRSEVEGEFKRVVLPSLLDKPKHLMVTAAMAKKSPIKPLVWAVNDAIQLERRQPYAMMFALRGAFHHRKLNFFRANEPKGPEFVVNAELKPFDADHAIAELAAVSRFLEAHPCLDKSEFPTEIPEFEKHLNWLVSTGHAVAFTNGVFSAVEKFPKYGPQWKKRAEKREEKREENVEKVEEKKDETAPVVAE